MIAVQIVTIWHRILWLNELLTKEHPLTVSKNIATVKRESNLRTRPKVEQLIYVRLKIESRCSNRVDNVSFYISVKVVFKGIRSSRFLPILTNLRSEIKIARHIGRRITSRA